jgi:hypothetical protein
MTWTRAQLLPWQDRVDDLADAATEGLGPARPADLYAAVEERVQQGHPGARDLWAATRQLPPWTNPDALEAGRRLMVELGIELALVLTTGGLIEGYTVPSLSTPLLRTGRLKTDAARRLYETGQMVHNARAPGGLAPDGIGRRTILQVRILHSVVRQHLERHGYVGPDGGRALHQLDMAHTATAFSHKGPTKLSRLGVVLAADEQAAIHHFFRVVNHLHGVDAALLPETPAETAELSAFLDAWRFDLSFAPGAELARSAIRSLALQPPFYLPEEAISTLSRRCMSAEQADLWGLSNDPRWNRAFDALVRTNTVITALWRRSPGLGRLRARANVALYGRTLVAQLGADPSARAFGLVAGEENRFGPGLERPEWVAWVRSRGVGFTA